MIALDGSSEDARYVARLHAIGHAALRERLQQALTGGLSQRELARRSRISVGTLRKVLTGDSDVGLGTMLALAEGLGLSSLDGLFAKPIVTALVDTARDTASRPAM